MTDNEKQILDEYRRSRSPFKTAKVFRIHVNDVWNLIEANSSYLRATPERFGGMGRPELRDFIVARRSLRGSGWDNNDPNIAKARALYELGHIDMTTGRDGSWEILYAIPRMQRQPRPGCWALGIL
jgi:hypothetical protein